MLNYPDVLKGLESGKVFGSPFMLLEKVGGATIGHMQNLPKQRGILSSD